MRSILIVLALFALFLVISCSDEFPSAPEFKFCKFEKQCESIHKIPLDDCNEIGGTIVDTCEEPSGGEDPLLP